MPPFSFRTQCREVKAVTRDQKCAPFHWLQPLISGSSRCLHAPAKFSPFFPSSAHHFTTVVCCGTIRTSILTYVSHRRSPGLPGHSSFPNSDCDRTFLHPFSDCIFCSFLILKILPLSPLKHGALYQQNPLVS